MTYITNTTANRLKITKGWKHSKFPEKLNLYSRDNIFFFKLFLFLKAYFNLKKINLVSCDFRIAENYTKLLYLIINNLKNKKKKKPNYRFWYIKQSPSKFKFSPFRNAHFHLMFNLFYLNLTNLKTKFIPTLAGLSKQKVFKLLYNKPRYKSWINFVKLNLKIRQNQSLQNINTITKWFLLNNLALSQEQTFQYKVKYLKNLNILINRFFLSGLKQKKLFKNNLVLHKLQLTTLQKKSRKLINAINQSKLSLNWPKTPATLHKIKNNKTIHITTNTKRFPQMKFQQKSRKWKQKRNKKIIKFIKKNITTNYLNTYQHLFKKRLLKYIKKNQFQLKFKTTQTSKFYSNNLQRIFWKKNPKHFKLKPKQKTQFVQIFNKPVTLPKIPKKKKWKIKFSRRKRYMTLLKDQLYKQLQFNLGNIYAKYIKENHKLTTPKNFFKFWNLYSLQKPTLIWTKPIKLTSKRCRFQFLKRFTTMTFFEKPSTSNLQNLKKFQFYIKKPLNIFKKHLRRGRISKPSLVLSKFFKIKQKQQISFRKFYKHANHDIVFKKILSKLNNKKKKVPLQKELFIQKKKKKIWFIKEFFKHKSKRHNTLLTKYQYKVALQQILFSYFKMNFEIKINRPLTQFKNLKFFRFIFFLKHYQRKKNTQLKTHYFFKQNFRQFKIKQPTHGNKILSLRKRYLFLGNKAQRFKKKNLKQNTNLLNALSHLQNKINAKKQRDNANIHYFKTFLLAFHNSEIFAKINFDNEIENLQTYWKMHNNFVIQKLMKKFKKDHSHTIYKPFTALKKIFKKNVNGQQVQLKKTQFQKNSFIFIQEANFFQRVRKKTLLNFSQSELQSVRHKLIIRRFLPTASLFIKYLNPQLLADHIAKELERNKKQQSVIYSLSTALRTLPSARGLGYRISIKGRINSSNRTRSYVLTRNTFKPQKFTTTVNFAFAQANARIGSFGIKVWLFY